MKAWIGVVSLEHVRRGVKGGFAQLCHGREGPLKKMAGGDWLIYYSPRLQFDGDQPCQAFSAIGKVGEGLPSPHPMAEGFVPWRRDVSYLASQLAPIAPLKPQLRFIRENRNWGMLLRRGHFEIALEDLEVIAGAMRVRLSG